MSARHARSRWNCSWRPSARSTSRRRARSYCARTDPGRLQLVRRGGRCGLPVLSGCSRWRHPPHDRGHGRDLPCPSQKPRRPCAARAAPAFRGTCRSVPPIWCGRSSGWSGVSSVLFLSLGNTSRFHCRSVSSSPWREPRRSRFTSRGTACFSIEVRRRGTGSTAARPVHRRSPRHPARAGRAASGTSRLHRHLIPDFPCRKVPRPTMTAGTRIPPSKSENLPPRSPRSNRPRRKSAPRCVVPVVGLEDDDAVSSVAVHGRRSRTCQGQSLGDEERNGPGSRRTGDERGVHAPRIGQSGVVIQPLLLGLRMG